MNRIFKTVWSRTKNMYVVVSEIANSYGKSKGGHVIDRKAAFVAVLILTSSVPFGIQAALTPDQQVVYDAVIQQLAQTSGKAALGKVKVDNDKETLSLGYVQLDGKHGNLYLGTKAAGNEVGISQTQYTHGISGSNIAWGSGNVAGLALEAETKEAIIDGTKTNIITGYKRTRQADGFMIPLWNINSSGAARSYSTAIGFLNASYGVGAFSVGQYSVAGADSAFAGGHDAIASAKQAFAFGKEVKAMGENSVAMGEKSEAWAKNSFALGNTAKALDVGAVAMGNDATASGKSSFAVGVKSKAVAYSTVALGDNAAAEGNYSVAMGHKAKATEENSSAVGTWAKATGQYSSALGTSSKAFGFLSTAVGGGKVSENGDNGLSMGYGAQTTVADGVSVGSNSVASRSENVYGYNVLGGNAYDTESIGAVYGQGKKEEIEGYNKSLAEKQPQLEAAEAAYNKAQQDLDDMFHGRSGALEFTSANRQKLEAEIERTKQVYENLQKDFDEIKVKRNKLTGAYLSSSAAVSVGDEETGMTRQITGVAAGTKDTDAVNVAQLKALNKKVDGKKDIHFFSSNGLDSDINYDNQGARAGFTTAIGPDAMATEENSQAFGFRARAIGHSSIVFGVESTASGARDIAIGYGTHAVGSDNTNTSWNDTIAIGWNALSRGGSFASGSGAVAGGSGSVALGSGAYVGTKWLDDETQKAQNVNKWVLTRSFLDKGLRDELKAKFPEKFAEWERRAKNMPVAMGSEYLEQKLRTMAMEQLPQMTSPSMNNKMKDMDSSIAIGHGARVYSASAIAIGSKAKVGENLDDAIALGNQSLATRNAGGFGYDPTSDATTWTAFKKVHPEVGVGAAREQEITRELNNIEVEMKKMGNEYAAWIDKEQHYDNYKEERKAYAEAHGSTLDGNNEWVEWIVHVRNEQQNLRKKGQELYDKFSVLQKELNSGKGAWVGGKAALAIGNEEAGVTRQITGVAAGTKDTDAVNVAQLKVLNTKVDKVAANSGVHYFSVNSSETGEGSNYDNDGAKAANSMVIGIGSTSEGINSTVIGNNNKLTGNKSLRRKGKEVKINNSIVAGQNLEVDGYCNSVFATDYVDDTFHGLTKVAGEYNTVLGAGNVVGYALEDKGKDYIYTRLDENISNNKNVVIGTRQTVSGSSNVVIGDLTKFEVGADQVTTIGIDNRIGSEAREGVAIGNHLGINGYQTVAIGFGSEANAESAIAFGSYSFANAESAISIGNGSYANAKNSVAIGGPLRTEGAPPTGTEGALATVENGVALGAGSVADREAGMAGYLSNGKTTAEWQSTLGALSVGVVSDEWTNTRQITGVAAGTEDTDAVNVAQLKAVESKITQVGAETQKPTSVTAGKNISVSQNSTNAEGGKNYEVSLAKDIDLGQDGSIKAGNTTINKGGVTTNTVKAGDTTINNDGLTIEGGPVITKTNVDVNNQQIHHVKDGTADDDAATVGQVKEKIKKITTTVTGSSVTGGTIGEDGKISLTKGDKKTVELQGQLKDISAQAGDYEIKDNEVAIELKDNYSKNTAGNIVIKDVAKASLLAKEVNDREKADIVITETIGAANKDELKTAYQDTTYIKNSTTLVEADKALDKAIGKNAGDIKKNTETINILGKQVGNLDTRVNRVGAGAAALAALHPLNFDPDDKWDFAAGYGNYMGANALALGAFYRPNETTQFSIGGSFGNGENMINAGVSLKVGKGSLPISSKVEMTRQLTAQAQEIERLQQKDKERDMVLDNLQKYNKEQSEKITAMNDIVQQLQKEIERLKHK